MNIIGNENIVKFLDKSADTGTLAHSYIFYGPKNVGKKTVARELAAKLLKTSPEKLALQPDFIEPTYEKNAVLKEEMDNIISRLTLSSFGKGYKVLIINHAHLMNTSSANAFLKTLEEPPKNTLIILLTSELGKLLPTIISRSCLLQFKLTPKKQIKNFLKEELKIENTQKYANISFGRPGRAIKLAKTDDWELRHNQAIKEFENLFFADVGVRFRTAAELLKDKNEKKERLSKKIDFWMEALRDIILLKYQLNDEVVHSANYEILDNISKKQKMQYFTSLGARLLKMRELINKNINSQLLLENLII